MQAVSVNARAGLLPFNRKRATTPRCSSRPLRLRASLGEQEEVHHDWPQRIAATAMIPMMVVVAALFPMDAEAKKSEPPPPPPTEFDVRLSPLVLLT